VRELERKALPAEKMEKLEMKQSELLAKRLMENVTRQSNQA
jgi:hypothetical protein